MPSAAPARRPDRRRTSARSADLGRSPRRPSGRSGERSALAERSSARPAEETVPLRPRTVAGLSDAEQSCERIDPTGSDRALKAETHPERLADRRERARHQRLCNCILGTAAEPDQGKRSDNEDSQVKGDENSKRHRLSRSAGTAIQRPRKNARPRASLKPARRRAAPVPGSDGRAPFSLRIVMTDRRRLRRGAPRAGDTRSFSSKQKTSR